MAPKRSRACNCGPPKNRRAKKKCQDCLPRNNPNEDFLHRLRPRSHKLNVADLVYKFLGNVATMTARRKQKNNAYNNFKRAHVKKKRNARRPDARLPLPEDLVADADFGMRFKGVHPEPSVMILQNSVVDRVKDGNKMVKDQSSIQIINGYIKAINNGKRRAKKYMRKALSFGVDYGYLVPTDVDRQVLRVSSALFGFPQKKGPELERDDRERRSQDDGSASDENVENEALTLTREKRGKKRSPKRKVRSRSRSPSAASCLHQRMVLRSNEDDVMCGKSERASNEKQENDILKMTRERARKKRVPKRRVRTRSRTPSAAACLRLERHLRRNEDNEERHLRSNEDNVKREEIERKISRRRRKHRSTPSPSALQSKMLPDRENEDEEESSEQNQKTTLCEEPIDEALKNMKSEVISISSNDDNSSQGSGENKDS